MIRVTAKVAICILLVQGMMSGARAQDWPITRHDTRRTAFQPVGVDIDEPGEVGRVQLGGSPGGRAFWVYDADGDGTDEVYAVVGGRVLSFDSTGTIRWASDPLALTEIHGLIDLNGDGRLELLASASARFVWPMVFDALTGALIWQATLDPNAAVGDVFPLDVDGSRRLFIAEYGGINGGHATGRIYDFSAGLTAPEVTPLDTSAHGYWLGRGLTLADLDGDGRDEIVALSNDRAIAYDTLTGLPRWTSPDLGVFPHGVAGLNAADVDGDGRDEIAVMSNNAAGLTDAAKRMLLLEVESDALNARWEMRLDATLGEHLSIRDNIGVLRTAALPSIVTSVFDPVADEYQTLIYAGDSATATPSARLRNRVIVAMANVTGDAAAELLTLDVPGASVPEFGTIRVLSLQAGGSFTELARVDQARVALSPVAFWIAQDSVSRAADDPVLLRDLDGDERPDEVRTLDGTEHYLVPDGVTPTGVRAGVGGAVWIAYSDGRIGKYNQRLELQNDSAPADGRPDLSYPTYSAPSVVSIRSGSGVLVALVDPREAPVVYDLSAEPRLLWSSPDHVAQPLRPLTWLPGPEPTLLYAARESDGTLVLVARRGSDGAQQARISYGMSVSNVPQNDIVPLHGPRGSLVGVVGPARNLRTGDIHYPLFDLATSTKRDLDLTWNVRNGAYPVTAHDWDGDGVEDAFVMHAQRLRVASGATGARLRDEFRPPSGSMWSFVDLDEDGTLDALRQGGFENSPATPGFGVRRAAADLSMITWTFDLENRQWPVSMSRQPTGIMHLGLTRRREAWFGVLDSDGTLLGSSVPASGNFFVSPAAADAAHALQGELTPSVGVAAHDPGRVATIAFGSSDGYLYAARASDGGLLWSFPLRARVSEPIPTDVDNDGQSELLVSAGDGALHIIGPALLPAPSMVFDNDGTSVAGSAAADVDEIRLSTRVGADWKLVPGATGYEVQLLREDDFVIVPWVDVGPQLRATFEGLSLGVGPRYSTLVRAYDHSSLRPRVSPEQRSDGFVVVDSEPAELELTAIPAHIYRVGDGGPQETAIHFVARDAVGLRRFAIRVDTDTGAIARANLESGPASGVERVVDLMWAGDDDVGEPLAVGRYQVVGEADDLAGRLSEARAEVVICGVGAPLELGCSEGTDAGTRDAGGDASGSDGTLAGGGGCGCVVGEASDSRWRFGVAALLLAALAWRRSRRQRHQHPSE